MYNIYVKNIKFNKKLNQNDNKNRLFYLREFF